MVKINFNLTQYKVLIFFFSLAMVLLIGHIDSITGKEISVTTFYLIPVSIAAWYVGPKTGYLISLLSTVVWFLADVVAGASYTHFLIPFWNGVGILFFFTGSVYLLVYLKKEIQTQKQLAMEDFLTKVSNGRAFYNYAKIELSRIQRYDSPLTLVYLDLDNFKAINDSLGHAVGDRLLYTVAHTIRTNIRLTDAVARLGGDEFAILLPSMDFKATPAFVNKIRESVDHEMKKNNWPVSLSAGVVTYMKAPDNVDEMIKLADNLMYTVKKQGKNDVKYIVYD